MPKLTARTVDSLVKAGLPGMTGDGDGLYFQVSAAGGTSWIYRYKVAGKSRKMGLGRYPETSLSEARQKAAEARRVTLAGLDPLAERDAEQERRLRAEQEERERIEAEKVAAEQAKARAVTFKQAADDYIRSHRKGWKSAKHTQQWENTLETYAHPKIGHLITSEVTTEHLLEILQPIWQTKTETASRVRNRIELVLYAAKARGLREGENPARWRGHLDKLLPRRDKVQAVKHHPALAYRELPAFMVLLDGDDMTSKAMQMTILTACRSSEVLNATWDEIDTGARLWTIPAERMKVRKEHRVPLADAVLSLLESLPRVEGNPYLFPGMKAGRPLSNMAMLMGLRRMKRDDLTMHGFRSTFRDWAGECTAHPRDVCEQALAHSLGNDVEAAYRRGDLLEKRRALMDDWAAYAMTKPAENVIRADFKKA